jgi:tetratricopeptide (TPR) repeat protein
MDTEAQIEILPTLPGESVLETLNELISQSKEVYAAISYWTIDHRILHKNFIKSISEPGFLCIDIHYPTNIDVLLPMAEAGANLFLHLYKIPTSFKLEGIKGLPNNLMHSKVFYFLMNNGSVKIWIGSHNATNRALQGVNIETAVIVTTSESDKFAKDVKSFLDDIKNKCTSFEKEKVDYYKSLQSGDEQGLNDNLIKLDDPDKIVVNKSDKQIQELSILLLFPDSNEKYKTYKTDDKIFIFILDKDKRFYYEATISNSGRIDQNREDYPRLRNNYYVLLDIPKGRGIIRENNDQSFEKIIEINQSKYYIILDLQDKLPHGTNFKTKPSKWEATNHQYADIVVFDPGDITNGDNQQKPEVLIISYDDTMKDHGLRTKPNPIILQQPAPDQDDAGDLLPKITKVHLIRDPEGYLKRGLQRYKSKDWEGAIADFEQLKKLNNHNYVAKAYYYCAWAKFKSGKSNDAIEDFKEAIKIYNTRGLEQYSLKEYQKAIDNFYRVIKIHKIQCDQPISSSTSKIEPSLSEAYNNRGVAKYDLGEKENAIKDFDKAIELDPKFAIAYFNRGVAKYELDEKGDANTNFDKAIEFDSNLKDLVLLAKNGSIGSN